MVGLVVLLLQYTRAGNSLQWTFLDSWSSRGKNSRKPCRGRFVSAIMEVQVLKEALLTHFLQAISNECSRLCQTSCTSLFRKIPLSSFSTINWLELIAELGSKAPTLLQTLLFLVSANDARNTTKVGAVHFPGICAVVAVILKERCREMCGVQSLISVLMYGCHCEKQVANTHQKKM